MKKVLVTGAGGFIGSELMKALSVAGIQSIAVVREAARYTSFFRGSRVVQCSMEGISQLPHIIPERDIDTCIHLAWAGSFGDGRASYGMQLDNVKYTMALVDAAAKMGIRRFVGAGTLAEKDVLNYHPMDGAAPNVTSIYGAAKLAAQFMSKAQCAGHGMEHVWCCLPNTYGVGNTTDNFVNMACRRMLSGQRASFTDGEQPYDFSYVTDTAGAVLAAAGRGRPYASYYLGSGSPRRLKEYIRAIRDAVDPSIELHLGEIPFQGRALPVEAYSTAKLEKDTGFEPQVCFEDGIRRTVGWLRKELSGG